MFDFKMDAHMHFDLYENRNSVIEYIMQQKSYTIAVTNLPDIYKRYLNKYENNQYFKIALGMHPELSSQYIGQLHIFESMCETTRFIGEVGLDFSNASTDEIVIQKDVFEKILGYCSNKDKILSVHSRKADTEVMKLLDGFIGKVVLHWYTGNLYNIDIAIKRGYFFSINQQMIRSKAGQKIISRIPVDHILVESDAPFTRGMDKEYKIDFMYEVYNYIAGIYKQDTEVVMKRIKTNFIELLK